MNAFLRRVGGFVRGARTVLGVVGLWVIGFLISVAVVVGIALLVLAGEGLGALFG